MRAPAAPRRAPAPTRARRAPLPRRLETGIFGLGGAFVGELLTMHLPKAAARLNPIGAPAVCAIVAVAAWAGGPLQSAASKLKNGTRRRNPSSAGGARSRLSVWQFGRNRERALRLRRKAEEMGLEMRERQQLALERKTALAAAQLALSSAKRWATSHLRKKAGGGDDAAGGARDEGGETRGSDMSLLGFDSCRDEASDAARRELEEATKRVERLESLVVADEKRAPEMQALLHAMQARAIEANILARSAQRGYFSPLDDELAPADDDETEFDI